MDIVGDLPCEIGMCILSFVPEHELCYMRIVSHRWEMLIEEMYKNVGEYCSMLDLLRYIGYGQLIAVEKCAEDRRVRFIIGSSAKYFIRQVIEQNSPWCADMVNLIYDIERLYIEDQRKIFQN